MILSCLFAAVALRPEFTPVLRIGAIDGSCADLKVVALDGTIGRYAKDTPIEPSEWPAVQPGAIDAWAGSRAYTYRFTFDRPAGADGGTYRVRIGFLGAHPNFPPTLRVQMGERVWSEQALAAGKQYIPRDNAIQETSPSVLEMDVPAAALPGSGPVTVSISQVRPSSWVFYDGIEVLYSKESAAPEISGVSLTPMPLVRADGGQVVRVRARCRGVPAPLSLRLGLPSGAVEREVGGGGSAVLNGDIDAEVLVEPAGAERAVEAVLSGGAAGGGAGGEAVSGRASFTQRPVRHFELYVVPEAHFDNGYTHPQEECVARAVANLRSALELAGRFENFSWTSESAYIVQRWWEKAPAEERERFVALARSGRVGFDAAYCNILSGLCTGEELRRLFSFAGSFAGAQRIDLRTATLTDAPSHTWSMPSALADAGIEFLSIGGNPTRGGLWKLGQDLFWKPVLWEGPDGARVFTLFHHHYAHATIVGLTSSLADAERGVPKWLEAYDTPEYPYDIVHLHGAYWDNALVDARLPETVKAWNEKYRWPRVRLATNAEFLERLRGESGEVAVVRGDGGAYWEDGAASSAAFTTINRDNARRLSLVETVLAAEHARGQLAEYPAEEIRKAWENVLLYDEHTWGAAWSITRPEDPGTRDQFERKARFATDAQRQIGALQALAAAHEPALKTPERGLDSSGVGVRDGVITSPFYRVVIDPGTGLVRSIVDLGSGRELVEAGAGAGGAGGFGQLVYERKPRRDPPDGGDLAPGSERSFPELVSIEAVPGGLRSRFRHPMFPRADMTVLLDAGTPRVEIVYDLEKVATTACEGVYFAFPFAAESPAIDYQNAGAIVHAGGDWLPHACLDWFTTEGFVRLRNADGFGIAWSSPDAPLFELQDITTHRGLSTLPIRNGRVYSYVMNNYWETNYKASQGGALQFRYAITSDADLSVERSLELGSPWSGAVQAALEGVASAEPASVRVVAFKRAEDGDGYIVRLWNSGDYHGVARVRVGALEPGGLWAERVNSTETPWRRAAGEEDVEVREGRVRVHIDPHETVTLRVRRGG